MLAERLGTRQTCLDFFAHYFLSARLFESASNRFFFDRTGHNQYAIHVCENQVAGFDMDCADFDWASIVHNFRANTRVLRIPSPAENGPVLRQDLRRVTVKSINDRAKTAACPRRGGKNFAPRGAVVTASRGHVDLTGKNLVN